MEVPTWLVKGHIEAASNEYEDAVRRAALPPVTVEQRDNYQVMRDAFAAEAADRFRALIADRPKYLAGNYRSGKREEYAAFLLSTKLDAAAGTTRALLAVPFREFKAQIPFVPVEVKLGFDIVVEASDEPVDSGIYTGDEYVIYPEDRGHVGSSLDDFAQFLGEVIALEDL